MDDNSPESENATNDEQDKIDCSHIPSKQRGILGNE